VTEPHIAPHFSPPSTTQITVAAAVACAILLLGGLAVPFGSLQLGINTSFLPAFGSLTFIGDLITALLLFSYARALNDRPIARLGAAYFFSALVIIPHLMAFPGVFAATSVIGNSASAVWLWVAWHSGFALGVVSFARLLPAQPLGPARVAPIVLGVLGLVIAAAIVATMGEPLLPTILVNGSYARLTTLGIGPAVLIFNVAGLVLVARHLRKPSILTLWLAVAMLASTTDVFLSLVGTGRFTLGWYVSRSLAMMSGITVLSALLMDLVRLFNSVTKANMRLEQLSLTDPLTEIANRRAFHQRLDAAWRQAIREQLPLSLVMIDVDHFKRYNDRFGHSAGDECLRVAAAALVRCARRPYDMVARLGGEEFAVLLPQTEDTGAAKVAEVFRAAIEHSNLLHPDSTFETVTISIGVATVFPYAAGQTQAALIDAADAALYDAKNGGRNCVRQHGVSAPRAVIEAVAGDDVRTALPHVIARP
jgi:diguanylate cyclase (GGDEF)-like protein